MVKFRLAPTGQAFWQQMDALVETLDGLERI